MAAKINYPERNIAFRFYPIGWVVWSLTKSALCHIISASADKCVVNYGARGTFEKARIEDLQSATAEQASVYNAQKPMFGGIK